MSEKKQLDDKPGEGGTPKKIDIPRRVPSVVVPPRKITFVTADKLTCDTCTCYPKEDPYVKDKKLNECQKSPLTLYELASKVVDGLQFPEAFDWSCEDVAEWMANEIGLPEYMDCIRDNHIDGRRLLRYEDPSVLPEINIRNWSHIKAITSQIRNLYGTDFVKFSRSIGLPPRKPLTHCTWFKSRTGPNWGIRKNWTRCDILRWMKILMPEPVYRDHWDLVWYLKPDYPRVKFARIPSAESQNYIPIYKDVVEVCNEYLTPRKFKFDTCISESQHYIWMQRPRDLYEEKKKRRAAKRREEKMKLEKKSKIEKKVDIAELRGEQLILARRLRPKQKFLA